MINLNVNLIEIGQLIAISLIGCVNTPLLHRLFIHRFQPDILAECLFKIKHKSVFKEFLAECGQIGQSQQLPHIALR